MRYMGFPLKFIIPTVRQCKRAFAPWFALREIRAVGLAIPPSYMESWASQHPTLFHALTRVDRAFRNLPGCRVLGDHVLLAFTRCDV